MATIPDKERHSTIQASLPKGHLLVPVIMVLLHRDGKLQYMHDLISDSDGIILNPNVPNKGFIRYIDDNKPDLEVKFMGEMSGFVNHNNIKTNTIFYVFEMD